MPAPLPDRTPEPDPPGSFLFPDEVIAEITNLEKRGIYTTERLERLRPDTFKSVLKLLCDRWPVAEIARTLNVAEKTVVAVADRHADRITDLEANFSKKARRCAWYQLDRVERNPGLIPAQAIAQSVKYFYEVGQLADGRPTEIIEERHEVNIYDHWRRFVRGETIGLSGEKLPPINGELAPAPAAALPAPVVSPSDSESEFCGPPTQGNGLAPYDLSHDSGSKTGPKSAAEAEPPGGGCGGHDGGATHGGVNGPQKFSANGEP